MTERFDYALVGGGLQNALIALAIRAHQPAARIAMIERGDAPGGNHTWCFHAQDVSSEAERWIEPLVAVRWPGYDVAFADHERRLDTPYACVTSTRVAQSVEHALATAGSHLWTRAVATSVGADAVEVALPEGQRETIHAHAVIDARGPDQIADSDGGWQKFVGQELALSHPHGLERPILMDARVAQRDGFRFFYVLPLAADRVLVEDTYFSDSSHLDVSAVRDEIARYVEARRWTIARVEREEVGLLPMPVTVRAPATTAPLVAGYAGGWFHPVTAYSFPIAARLAALVARRTPEDLYGADLDAFASAHATQLAFASRLNRMLFRWFPPANRHHVLARFYRLPPAVIERFYALTLTRLDRARILVGRPPRGLSLRTMFGAAR